jgi:peptidoglycan hydrolase-like protein with peptidoglycan-binding domain
MARLRGYFVRQLINLSAARRAAGMAAAAAGAVVLTAGLTALLTVASATGASATLMPPAPVPGMTVPGMMSVPAQAAVSGVASVGYTPAGRTLREGMHGADVRRLQDRLAQLKYYPGRRDGRFGPDTLEAVWAFQEVQRIPVTGVIGKRMDWRLAHPSPPRPVVRSRAPLRVVVDLRHEVLYVYHHGQIVLISHVSSGGGYYYCSQGSCSYAVTPTGNFRTQWRVHGWHVAPLGLLYNPVFFYGGFAIHGDTEVPLQPVSHGCVRIPMDIARFFPRLVPREGIPVFVRR